MQTRAIIQDSLDYIEENLRAEITAQELADRAGFSLFHYYRLFQSAVGMPVMQYIVRRKLLHGIYAVSRGTAGLDAALAYGFDTYAGFYRAFRREFGHTPSAFLKRYGARKPHRINLSEEEHIMVTRKKVGEFLKHWGMEKEPVTDIYYENTGERNEHAYYVGDRYVIKFTADPGRLQNHIRLSAALENVGLSAAVPIPTMQGAAYVQEGELYFFLTNRLSGSQITSAELFTGNFEAKARFIGEILGQLHLALAQVDTAVDDADLCASLRDWAMPKIQEHLPLSKDRCEAFLNVFSTLYDDLPRRIIHRDPNPGNIICSEHTWGFIDFELSERNVRIFDPCYAATAVLSEIFGKREEGMLEKWLLVYRNILYGYDNTAKLCDAERRAVPYVLLANQFISTAWFAGSEKYAELFKTNRDMTIWLLSVFEQLKLE